MEDPLYTGPTARFLADRVTGICGYRVDVDLRLHRDVVQLDHDEGIIRIRPGLPLAQYHYILARARLRITHGPEAVPEFGSPRTRLSSAGANISVPRPAATVHDMMVCPQCQARMGTGG